MKKEEPIILSKIDIANRWGLSRQNVNNLANRHSDFPEPSFYIANGKIPLYKLEDVEAYEKRRKRKAVAK